MGFLSAGQSQSSQASYMGAGSCQNECPKRSMQKLEVFSGLTLALLLTLPIGYIGPAQIHGKGTIQEHEWQDAWVFGKPLLESRHQKCANNSHLAYASQVQELILYKKHFFEGGGGDFNLLLRLESLEIFKMKRKMIEILNVLVPSICPSSDSLYALQFQDETDVQGSLLHKILHSETILVIVTELTSIMNTIQLFMCSFLLVFKSISFISQPLTWHHIALACVVFGCACVNIKVKVNLLRMVLTRSAYQDGQFLNLLMFILCKFYHYSHNTIYSSASKSLWMHYFKVKFKVYFSTGIFP